MTQSLWRRALRKLFVAQTRASAQALAAAKPLRRVPGWWSGHAFVSPPTEEMKLRQRLCEALKGQKINFRWHDNLKLELGLGNDIGRLLFLTGEIDPNEFSFLAEFVKPGMCVIDVGANEGLYTMFLRCRVGPSGKVIAIEPSKRELRQLKHNLDLNDFADIEIHAVALGNNVGTAKLHIAEDGHAGHNALGNPAAPWVHVKEILDVAVTSLDLLAETHAWPHVDLIKLDIEGAELDALRGAELLLQRSRPVLLLEAEPESLELRGDTLASLLSWLAVRGYDISEFSPETGEPAPVQGTAPLTANIIAMPRPTCA